MWLLCLVYQHLLDKVVRQNDDLQCFAVSQLQRGELAISDPLLCRFLSFCFQYFEAFLSDSLDALVRAHLIDIDIFIIGIMRDGRER